MPSVFRTHFKAIGFPLLLAQHGEPIVYFPRSGGFKPINAIVSRGEVEVYSPGGEVQLAKFVIKIYDDCTTGMQSNDIDTGGDEVELLADEGDVIASRFTVIKKINQSGGKIELALA